MARPVTPGTWKEVVRITSGGGGCTATIVGPRVIITAAHCASNGATARFTYGGKAYEATIRRSPIYPGRDHDISIGTLNQDIVGAVPMKIGGVATVGTELTILGYGCTAPPGTGGNDGILRIGKSVVVGFSNYDMVSRRPGGAALCYGDSGGPAFTMVDGKPLLLGINSKGNIEDTNYNTRLDRKESLDFLKTFSATICGINSECGSEPPPADPTCTLTANPATLKVGESLSLVLGAQNAVSADIDGTPVNVPNGERRLTPSTAGSFSATATVKNSVGKVATCSASYSVSNAPLPETRPSCRLTAVPAVALVGETISLELQASGQVDFASIEGNTVSTPVGKLNITRAAKGDYSATGFVRGPGGSANCYADFTIQEGQEPAPLPEFSIVATHCGPNRLAESGIKSACLALVKSDASWKDFYTPELILVTNQDGSFEGLPVVARSTIASSPGASRGSESHAVYANGFAPTTTSPLLHVRKATLTQLLATKTPTAVEGRGSRRIFLVEKLNAFGVREHLPTVIE
jgi:hypothetical protein